MSRTSQRPHAAVFDTAGDDGTSLLRAAGYARLSSYDPDDAAIGRQNHDIGGRADRDGATVAHWFAEDDASAFSGKRRPEFEELLRLMTAGEIDILYVWRLDRLIRNLSDYERVDRAADEGDVTIIGVNDGVDTSTEMGRLVADLMFAMAQGESRTMSARVSRRVEESAQAGLPHGGRRPFGWEADGVTQRPEEAAAIAEAAERLLAGESLRGIAYAFRDRGYVAAQSGRPLSPSGLRNILTNPRQAGLRRHRRRKRNGTIISDETYPATWEPILSRETWEAVCARVATNSNDRPGRPATALLSAIAMCGKCSSPLYHSASSDRRRRYTCVAHPSTDSCGALSIAADAAEVEVRDRLLAALASGELAEALAEPDESANQAARDMADAEDRLEELAGDYADGTISRREWLAARDRLDERIRRARATLDAQSQHNVLADLPDTEGELRARWDAAGVDWRRSLLKALVERVEIVPGGKGGPFRPERIRITWRA